VGFHETVYEYHATFVLPKFLPNIMPAWRPSEPVRWEGHQYHLMKGPK